MRADLFVGSGVRAFARLTLLLLAASQFPGCASLTLNGCRRLGPCGELVVGECDGQLTCVGARGRVVHSEPYRPGSSPCVRCRAPEDDEAPVERPATAAAQPGPIACRP